MANRQMIVNYARTHLNSHYLWGSAGATPGGTDGAWYRTGSVTLEAPSFDPAKPSLFAAVCSVQGRHVCAGRFDKIYGGRQTRPEAQDLRLYLADQSSKVEAQREPFYNVFSPRVVSGHTIAASNAGLAWGEDCRDRRHFDCIGFINFVLSQSTTPFWSYSIPQYRLSMPGLETISLSAENVDGDILIKDHDTHIAFLSADGTVIQAEQAISGVHEDEKYNPKNWMHRRRVPDSACWP